MRRVAGVIAVLAVAGCATAPAPACSAGQEYLRTAQLFIGAGGPPAAEADIRAFVDQEVMPRFPDGVTVLDGGRQWRGAENQLIREAQKVVQIVLPGKRDEAGRLEAVRAAYKRRFRRETVVVTQEACVAA